MVLTPTREQHSTAGRLLADRDVLPVDALPHARNVVQLIGVGDPGSGYGSGFLFLLGLKCCNGGIAQARLPEQFLRVLAQTRRHADRCLHAVHAHGRTRKAKLAHGRIVQRHKEIRGLQMRIAHQGHRAAPPPLRVFQTLALRKPMRGVMLAHKAAEQVEQLVDMEARAA